MHGGFGVGPGQKNLGGGYDTAPSPDASPQEAKEEALKMSFGPGSYARKLLEGMGWKEVWTKFSSGKCFIFLY